MISLKRTRAIAKKEVAHVLRDPFTLLFAIGIPLFLVAVFGTAIDFDIKNVSIFIDDRDKSQTSRELVQFFNNTGIFNTKYITAKVNPESEISAEKSKGVIVIEPGFEKGVQEGKSVGLSGDSRVVQVIIDGADNSVAGSILGYLVNMQENIGKISANDRGLFSVEQSSITLKSRFLYNPELNSHFFIIPGLLSVVISIVSILLTALTVARDWENGPMEQLLSTPVRPSEIILGKITPYLFLGIGSIVVVYLLARYGFAVPFRGNHLVFIFACILFLTASLSQGILISVISRSQVISMQMAMISGLMPSILLSGFIFPIESMPLFFQYLTSILPVRWFMEISRDVFLKGSGVIDLLKSFLALGGLCLFIITMATMKFKKDLEP
ncbi:MAG: ABC transporter permease [Oligoflexia bacterium]|nr:ABC transporter permease [Oligoflexia bacterium]